jgi:CHAT domain-containing protein
VKSEQILQASSMEEVYANETRFLHDALRVLNDALALSAGDPQEEARCLLDRANLYFHWSELSARPGLIERTEADCRASMALSTPCSQVWIESKLNLASAVSRQPGRLEESSQLFAELVSEIDARAHPAQALRAQSSLAETLLRRDETRVDPRARAALEVAMHLAEELYRSFSDDKAPVIKLTELQSAGYNLAGACCRMGDLQGALEVLESTRAGALSIRVFGEDAPGDLSDGIIREDGAAFVYLLGYRGGYGCFFVHRTALVGPFWASASVCARLAHEDPDGRSLLIRFLLSMHEPGAIHSEINAVVSAMSEWIQELAVALRARSIREVVLIPCGGGLQFIPLAAVPYGDDPTRTREGTCLLEEFSVSYAPSRVLGSMARATGRQGSWQEPSLLGITQPDTDAPRLPVGGAELRWVASCFEKRALLRGESANVATLMSLLPTANYLHFGCHGEFDAFDPPQSRLRLTGAPLTIAEVASSPERSFSHVRMVVLSACQSAVTDIRRPGEALGFPSAFLGAGVPGVVGSLWHVPDAFTAILMKKFYSLHLCGDAARGVAPMDGASALCHAQAWMRRARVCDLLAYATDAEDDGGEMARTLERELANKAPDEPALLGAPGRWAGFIYVGG